MLSAYVCVFVFWSVWVGRCLDVYLDIYLSAFVINIVQFNHGMISHTKSGSNKENEPTRPFKCHSFVQAGGDRNIPNF